MTYQVHRNGQTYGPYTLEDLQRYVASGNVLPTDMAKADSPDQPDLIPVSQLLGYTTQSTAFPTPSPYAQTPYGTTPPAGYPNTAADATFPDPPGLHWGLVLLFTLLTCGLFMFVWNIIVSIWLQKVQPNSKALYLYIAAYFVVLLQGTMYWPLMHGIMHNPGAAPAITGTTHLVSLLGLISWLLRLSARFLERAAIVEHFNGPERIPVDVNPVMVFFFGGLYIQSVLNNINNIKQAARMGQPRPY